MLINEASGGQYLVALSESELIVLSNCLNEVCNGIDLTEFETRVGASKDKVAGMLRTISVGLAQKSRW
jgi:hypothetical protein